jgi:hypothetical protein
MVLPFLSFGLLALTFLLQAPAPSPYQLFRISGVVVSAVNGQPISRAQLSIGSPKFPDSPRTVSASDDGRFVFENLPAGTYQLTARRKGYIQQAYKQHDSFSTGIVVGPGLNTDNLRFELRPAASISGQILDEMNDPVRNAQVMLMRQGLRSGRSATWRQGQITTDDEGHYHFGHLTPGNYLVAVSAGPWYARYFRQYTPRFDPNSGQPVHDGRTGADPLFDVTYPITFFSNAQDISAASPITLHPGDAATADITLQPIPGLHLIIRSPSSGESNASERFWANVTQHVADGLEEHVQAQSQEIAPGVIEVSGLPPGRFTLALNSSKGNESTTRSQVLQVIQDSEINASEALPSSSISGVIKKDDGSPFSRPVNLQLRASTTQAVLVAQSDANGEFALRQGQNVVPGTYEVTVPGAFAIRSLTAEGAKVSGHSVEIGPGQNVRLSVVVAQGTGQIKGVALKTGKPIDGVMIVLVPQDPEHNRELVRRDQSDSDGSFNLFGILPGKYTLIALENAWDSDWSGAALIQKYLAAGEPVQINADDKLQFKVQVQP